MLARLQRSHKSVTRVHATTRKPIRNNQRERPSAHTIVETHARTSQIRHVRACVRAYVRVCADNACTRDTRRSKQECDASIPTHMCKHARCVLACIMSPLASACKRGIIYARTPSHDTRSRRRAQSQRRMSHHMARRRRRRRPETCPQHSGFNENGARRRPHTS